MIRNWQASIESADLAEWITIGAYLLTALLCAQAASHARQSGETRERTFWTAASVVLVLLGINELLDLQTLLTSVGRAHARANDWYGQRREVQHAFVLVLAAMVTVAGIATLWLTKRTHHAVRLAQVGLALVATYLLIRAASFHHVDEILPRGMPGLDVGSLQELAGILIVATAALLYSGRRQGTS